MAFKSTPVFHRQSHDRAKYDYWKQYYPSFKNSIYGNLAGDYVNPYHENKKNLWLI